MRVGVLDRPPGEVGIALDERDLPVVRAVGLLEVNRQRSQDCAVAATQRRAEGRAVTGLTCEPGPRGIARVRLDVGDDDRAPVATARPQLPESALGRPTALQVPRRQTDAPFREKLAALAVEPPEDAHRGAEQSSDGLDHLPQHVRQLVARREPQAEVVEVTDVDQPALDLARLVV